MIYSASNRIMLSSEYILPNREISVNILHVLIAMIIFAKSLFFKNASVSDDFYIMFIAGTRDDLFSTYLFVWPWQDCGGPNHTLLS
jgi:hypothetical protein